MAIPKPEPLMEDLSRKWLNQIEDSRQVKKLEEFESIYKSTQLDAATQEVRLLKVLPGAKSENIRCELVKTTLTGSLPYEALSYTWGTSKDRADVELNGIHGFSVTLNLAAALRRLRYKSENRFLWVDAISICQTDADERSQQITLMGRIYNSATLVLVWLGDVDESLAPEMNDLEYSNIISGVETFCEQNKRQASLFHYLVTHIGTAWWQRAWIVQEFAMAKERPTVCFGPCETTWNDLMRLVNILGNNADRQYGLNSPESRIWTDLGNSFGRISMIRGISERPSNWHDADEIEQESIIEMSWILRPYSATDPRDRVYSLLSIIHTKEACLISPDYNRSCAYVFAQGTYASTVFSRTLECLKLVTTRTRRHYNLPSWSINFAYNESDINDDPLGQPVHVAEPWPDCIQFPENTVSAGSSFTTLTITGVEIDRIAFVVELPPHLWDGVGSETLQALKKTCRSFGLTLPHGQPYDLISSRNSSSTKLMKHGNRWNAAGNSWTDLLHALDACNEHMKAGVVLERLFKAWSTHVKFSGAGMMEEPDDSVDATAIGGLEEIDADSARFFSYSSWSQYCSFAADGSVFFTTKNGFLGIAPRSIALDETITLAAGSQIPLALRPQGPAHSFQGLAFVWGIMSGELSLNGVAQQLQYRKLTIS